MPPPNADTVRAFFRSFLAQDRDAAERLVAGEFVFTSPQVITVRDGRVAETQVFFGGRY